MTEPWPQARLGTVAEDVTVGWVGPMVSEYRASGVPFLRSLNVKSLSIDLTDVRYITKEFDERLSKSQLRPGDVVIVRTGEPGTTAVIPEWLVHANCADLVVVRPGARLNPHFFAYYLTALARHQIRSTVVGAVQQHFNVGSAKDLLIPFPDRCEQDEIVELLSTFDVRIDVNRRMSRAVEAIVATLFKSWFVHFDPVVDRSEGRVPAGLAETVSALFPATFQNSELGRIPAGWHVGTVYELAQVAYGAPYSSKGFNTNGAGLPLVRIRDLQDHRPSTYTAEIHGREVLVHPGDIVVGMDGEFRAQIWTGPVARLNQRLCTFRPHEPYNRAFVLMTIRPLLADVERTESGTTVIHLGKTDIDDFRCIVPPQDVLRSFGRVAEALLEKVTLSAQANAGLTALRDLLVPQLLSGRLRVGSRQPSLAPSP